jgi:TM2 domain-containing membrane protein YozV
MKNEIGYCGNCGEKLASKNAKFCVKCGADPYIIETYCNSCGEKLKNKNAIVCLKCGVPLKENSKELPGRKDPIIAALLSFMFNGVGQLYNGDIKKFMIIWILNFFIIIISVILMFFLIGFITILAVIPVWLYSIYDAYTVANEINKKLENE